MWFLRNPPKVECFFCKESVDKATAYKLEYSHVSGTTAQFLCQPCAAILNHLVTERETLNELID